MTPFKLLKISCSLALALSVMPITTDAKQKLDQPALLSSNALQPIGQLSHNLPNYVAVANDGRLFVQLPRYINEKNNPSLATLQNNTLTPYPGGQWNEWKDTQNNQSLNPQDSFVGLTGMTLTPDGHLWVVDNGIDHPGKTAIQKAIKLVDIDTNTNKIAQIIPLPSSVLQEKTIINAIAVSHNYAYVADSGSPAIIVINLKTKEARRVLDNSSSLYSRVAIIANNTVLRPNSDQNSNFNVNQLAITPDGKRLYYQAVSGPLYRIDTMYLKDPTYSPAELNEAMILWFKTPTSGGIVCDEQGNIFFTDVATNSIYRFSTGRILKKLITDPRLKWPAHPFVKDNVLYVPTIELDKTPLFNKDGKSTIQWPLDIYKINLPPIANK